MPLCSSEHNYPATVNVTTSALVSGDSVLLPLMHPVSFVDPQYLTYVHTGQPVPDFYDTAVARYHAYLHGSGQVTLTFPDVRGCSLLASLTSLVGRLCGC